ncbi:MAG: hypothetical protein LBT59_01810 [Clostridiales bacterium]|jgi:hypothetical protein|nr:hypothetical protein [Clostridiales bacterium]
MDTALGNGKLKSNYSIALMTKKLCMANFFAQYADKGLVLMISSVGSGREHVIAFVSRKSARSFRPFPIDAVAVYSFGDSGMAPRYACPVPSCRLCAEPVRRSANLMYAHFIEMD